MGFLDKEFKCKEIGLPLIFHFIIIINNFLELPPKLDICRVATISISDPIIEHEGSAAL